MSEDLIYTLLEGKTNAESIKLILDLHISGNIVYDVTYGLGRFWNGNKKYKVNAFDILPKYDYVIKADCRNIPMSNESSDCIVFDPPYMHAAKGSIMGNLGVYGTVPSQKYLSELMGQSDKEFYRLLKPDGIMVLKIMDLIESGKPVWNHIIAVEKFNSFYLDDIFIFPTKMKARAWNWFKQYHARKNHAYFMVFRKKRNRGFVEMRNSSGKEMIKATLQSLRKTKSQPAGSPGYCVKIEHERTPEAVAVMCAEARALVGSDEARPPLVSVATPRFRL